MERRPVEELNNYGNLRDLDEKYWLKEGQLAILGELFWLMSTQGVNSFLKGRKNKSLAKVKKEEGLVHEGFHLAGFVQSCCDHSTKCGIFFNDNFKGRGNNPQARLNGFATEKSKSIDICRDLFIVTAKALDISFLQCLQRFLEYCTENNLVLRNFKPEEGIDYKYQEHKRDYHAKIEPRDLQKTLEAIAEHIKRCETDIAPLPYKGLFAYSKKDKDIFFGRDDETEKIFNAIKAQDFLAIIGASGSGKSSLMYAGVIPKLEEEGWRFCFFSPSGEDTPHLKLAKAFLKFQGLDEVEVNLKTDPLGANFLEGPDRVLRHIDSITLDSDTGEVICHKLLIYIDQFEDLFTNQKFSSEAIQNFCDLLLFLKTGLKELSPRKFSVVLSVRNDRMDTIASLSPKLHKLIFEHHFVVETPSDIDLENMVIEPAKTVNVQFEAGLVGRIVKDVFASSNNLTLLQYVLEDIWRKQTKKIIYHRHYESLGPISELIGERLEKFYNGQTDEGKKELKRLFLALVLEYKEGEFSRQRIRLEADRSASFESIRKELEGPDFRILVSDRDGDKVNGKGTLEIIHDNVIDKWGRLLEWKRNSKDLDAWRKDFSRKVEEWDADNSDPNDLLTGNDLTLSEALLKKHRDALSIAETKYISDSINHKAKQERQKKEAIEREQRLKEEARQKEEDLKRRNMTIAMTILVPALVIIAVLLHQTYQRKEAAEQRLRQIHSINAQQQFVKDNSRLSIELALKAIPENFESVEADAEQKAIDILNHHIGEYVHIKAPNDHFNTPRWTPRVLLTDKELIYIRNNGDVVIYDVLSQQGTVLISKDKCDAVNLSFTESEDSLIVICSGGHILKSGLVSESKIDVLWHSKDAFSDALVRDEKLFLLYSQQSKIAYVDLLHLDQQHLEVLTKPLKSSEQIFQDNSDTIYLINHRRGFFKNISNQNSHEQLSLFIDFNYKDISKVYFNSNATQAVAFYKDGTAKFGYMDDDENLGLHHDIPWSITSKFLNSRFQDVIFHGETLSLVSDDSVHSFNLINGIPTDDVFIEGKTERFGLSWKRDRENLLRANDAVLYLRLSFFSPQGLSINETTVPHYTKSNHQISENFFHSSSDGGLVALLGHNTIGYLLSIDEPISTKSVLSLYLRIDNVPHKQIFATGEHSTDCLNFSDDAQHIAACTSNDTVKVWRRETSELVSELAGHENHINFISFDPSGNFLLSASDDKTSRVWDIKTGTELIRLESPFPVSSAFFNHDSSHIYAAANSKSFICEHVFLSHKLASPLHMQRAGQRINFEQDSSIEHTYRSMLPAYETLLEISNFQSLCRSKRSWINSFNPKKEFEHYKVSKSGNYSLYASFNRPKKLGVWYSTEDESLQVLDRNMELLFNLDTPRNFTPLYNHIKISSNGEFSSYFNLSAFRIWSNESGSILSQIDLKDTGFESGWCQTGFSANDAFLVLGCSSGAIGLWDVQDKKWFFNYRAPIPQDGFSPTSSLLLDKKNSYITAPTGANGFFVIDVNNYSDKKLVEYFRQVPFEGIDPTYEVSL